MCPKNILVASNDTLYRQHAVYAFKQAFPDGCYSESTGDRILSTVSSQAWDIIVAPLHMPEVTGLQLIDALAYWPKPPRLLLSHGPDRPVTDAVEEYARHKGVELQMARSGLPQRDDVEKMIDAVPFDARLPGPRQPMLVTPPSDKCLEQVTAYFQPQHRVDDGTLYGAEALARWRHPLLGILAPGYLLSRLHTPQQRRDLWDCMLGHVIRTSLDLARPDLDIALNVTTDVANSIAWAEDLAQRVNLAGLAPAQLTVEITEQAYDVDDSALAGVIAHLRLQGIHCAIDDFGTGSSSLQRLAMTPFNQLKIDRCFISQARTSLSAQKILGNTVHLAHDLGLSVVAEGVETEEDFQRIAALGCDIAQGYYFARPMSAQDFLRYAHRGAAPAQPRSGA